MTIHAHFPTRASVLAIAVAAAGIACGPDGPGPNGEPANVPGTDLWIDAGDGLDHGLMTTLELSMNGAEVEQGAIAVEKTLKQTLTVEGIFEDGATVEMTGRVEWSTDAADVIGLTTGATGVEVEGLAEGSANLYARIGDLQAMAEVTVMPPALIGLDLAIQGEIALRQVQTVIATATYRDGSTRDVTTEASWSSSAPGVITVLDDEGRKGLVWARQRGEETFTANLEDQTATLDVAVACGIEPSTVISPTFPMVNASWDNAVVYDVDGNKTERPLSVEDLMCDPAFDGFRAFAFSLNAGWCGPCHAWMRTAAAGEARLVEEGIMPIFVVGQTTERNQAGYDAATTAYAEALSTTHAGNAMSIRLGDAETMGAGPGIKQILNVTQAWPSLFVVNREDMRVLSLDSGAPRTVEGLVTIANSAGSSGGGNPVDTNCSDGAEEASEPNDTTQLAPSITTGEFPGGICDSGPDFFRVKVDGPWRASIMFSNSTADLDLYGWDENAGTILTQNEMALQSSSTRSDFESIEVEGEAMIRIQAKASGRTADYTLFIEPL